MSLLLASFWRAVAYCLHPRVIGMSLLPLLLVVALAVGLGYFLWDSTVNSVFVWLESTGWFSTVASWLHDMGMDKLRNGLAPLIVIFAVTPVLVVVVLFFVALLMAPAIVTLVARRRFPDLERKHGASFVRGAFWSLGSALLAVFALLISLPLWLIPPLILMLPPLIWGWLTYRVMAFDALADHASGEERGLIFRRHRVWLLVMGVVTGYLGAAPSIVWASGWIFAAAFPILIPFAIWVYTLVFAFSSLWFTHYCLAALQELRTGEATPASSQLVRP
jgi:hypothetical protein